MYGRVAASYSFAIGGGTGPKGLATADSLFRLSLDFLIANQTSL